MPSTMLRPLLRIVGLLLLPLVLWAENPDQPIPPTPVRELIEKSGYSVSSANLSNTPYAELKARLLKPATRAENPSEG